MMVVRCGRILVGGMALKADAVAGRAKFRGMRLVAVAASDAGREHLALLERAVIVDLVQHLAVGVIAAAGLDLSADEGGREVTLRVSGLGIEPPDHIAPLVEANQQTLGRLFGLAEPALLRARPSDVPRPLAVAGLATHADFRKARGEAIVGRVIVFAHAGRVALRAHEIPVLVQLGPMQDVVVLDLLVRVEVEPALAALRFRAAIPGDRERLQAAVREFDQVLLQRIDAEGVFHLERGELAVGSVGLDEEFPLLAEEAGVHAVIVETRLVEIAEYRRVGRMVHRLLVLRHAPELRPRGMALGAGIATGECERRSGGAEKTRPWRVPAGEPLPRHAAGEDCGRAYDNGYNPGLRRHCCISLRRASNDSRSASACLRQTGILCSTTLTAIARAGYGAAGTGQG